MLCSILSFAFWIFPPLDTAVQLVSWLYKQNAISKSFFQVSFWHIFWAMRKMCHTFWKKAIFSRSKCSNFLTLLRVLWSSISNVYLHTKGVSFALQTLSQGCLMVFSAKYRICHVVHIKGKANASSLLKPQIPTTKISSFSKEESIFFCVWELKSIQILNNCFLIGRHWKRIVFLNKMEGTPILKQWLKDYMSTNLL